MRLMKLATVMLALLVVSPAVATADDKPAAEPNQPQHVQQQQQQRRYYYRQPQQQRQGFWDRMMEMERRKNRFLLRMFGFGR